MKTRAGLSLIKQFEGCKLEAYLCPAKIWTLAWGKTTNVKRGDKCTQEQADAWLLAEYDKFDAAVRRMLNIHLTENQIGALVSFAYNVGTGSLKSSTLLRKINVGDLRGAEKEFARWNKAGGKELAGLTRRRAAEAKLFATK